MVVFVFVVVGFFFFSIFVDSGASGGRSGMEHIPQFPPGVYKAAADTMPRKTTLVP